MSDDNSGTDRAEGAREVDVVVIGLGPGGEALASSLAREGLEVVALDERLVGGECPYFGCVPSKMMIRAADLLAEPVDRLRLACDECLPFGFRQGDGDDPFALVAHDVIIRTS